MRRTIIATLALATLSVPALAASPKAAPVDVCAHTVNSGPKERWKCILDNPRYDTKDHDLPDVTSDSDPSEPYELCMEEFETLARTRISVDLVAATADKECMPQMLASLKADGPRHVEYRRSYYVQTYIRRGAIPSDAMPRVANRLNGK